MAIRPQQSVRRDLTPKPEPEEEKATSFSAILDQQVEDAERPKPLPVGTYLCVVTGLPRFDKSSRAQTDFAEFTLQPTEVYDDVDKDELEAMGGLENRTLRITFWLTEDAKWRLRKFLEDCGIDVSGKSFHEAIEEAPGQQVIANVTHDPAKDGSGHYAVVKSTAAVK